ncbi:unnamed protein product [Brachionus calyciflorus]|uniref:Sodium/calcium exchanger membrane region domain-containing protein n=1 Tax=Brachionus calyciflorus TaxID=104777 RepID=A0A813XN24_9BILA|nr:unnamed protein product [Brachionus calyciflorus]
MALFESVQCRDYHKFDFNSTWVCNFMKTTDDCQIDDGFINYLVFTYCSFSLDFTWLGVILILGLLVFLFISLGVTADTFAIAAVGNAKGGDAGLAFGALFGAGIFISTIIVGTICFISPFYSVQRPLLRDIVFFIAAGFWLFVVIWDGKIVLWETLGFLLLYVFYIFVVLIGRFVNQRIKIRRGIVSKRSDFSSEAIIRERENSPRASVNVARADFETENEAEEEYENEELTRPLLSRTHIEELPEVGFSQKDAFLMTFIPIEKSEWEEANLFFKLIMVVKAPIIILLKLTIPLVDYDGPNHNWNKITTMINAILAPMFMVFTTEVAGHMLFGVLPVWVIALITGLLMASLVWWFTDFYERPKYHFLLAYLGFAVSVIWIYSIANEIVNILTAFGVIMNISNTILGLTFLAWGNSMSDLVADVFSARKGFPNMAISACFGGPLFNILIGIGIPFTLKCIQSSEGFVIKQNFLLFFLALFLGISLLSSLIFLPFNNFYFSRKYALYLITIYVIFIIGCVLIESGVINPM